MNQNDVIFRVVGHKHHPQYYPKLMRVMFDWFEAKIQFHHQEAASLALLFLPVIPLTTSNSIFPFRTVAQSVFSISVL
ncbi:hypothetical protein [Nostoc sp. FACHB-133]|uniref:hypothetical protein n=1 Tax=Nostoc sp. FACHB-133 TaxID=2692835 RepID=UPI0016892B57|nr:hypothetical protein [Nostoc sp. FACHB-133]MBD2525053.1 hypothetical protein [Nostoc sp. FACHB-133]